ncbi:hypothetical protein A7982_13532 [Minicystis rosea]|nr:hypothetical protein A7982_13532 [Minicystis rosea]
MKRRRDVFEVLPKEQRLALMKETVLALLGDTVGGVTWARMEPALRYERRQPGDHLDPAKNHWKGAWRIYEAE